MPPTVEVVVEQARGRPAHAVTGPLAVGGQLIMGGRLLLCGWSALSATAGAICSLYDGEDATGQPVGAVATSTTLSDRTWQGDRGILCRTGLWAVTSVEPFTTLVLYVVPLDFWL
jgi:hypothetical protein